MQYAAKIITAPTDLPVTLTEQKAWMRVLHNDEDNLITALLTGVVGMVQNKIGGQLMQATRQILFDNWPSRPNCQDAWPTRIDVPYGPLVSVDWVKYYDTANVQQTLSSSLYVVDADSEPGRIVPAYAVASWPSVYQRPNAISVQYICGYATAAAVPDEIKTAIKMYVASLYENRELIPTDRQFVENATMLPGVWDLLLGPYMTALRV